MAISSLLVNKGRCCKRKTKRGGHGSLNLSYHLPLIAAVNYQKVMPPTTAGIWHQPSMSILACPFRSLLHTVIENSCGKTARSGNETFRYLFLLTVSVVISPPSPAILTSWSFVVGTSIVVVAPLLATVFNYVLSVMAKCHWYFMAMN